MTRTLLIFSFIFLTEINGNRHRCINTGVLLSDKVSRSPIVVYGKPVGKRIYLDTNIELLFNITFRVDCIFKGENIQKRIEITEAGIKAVHAACQWLELGQLYIVFLEKWGTNTNGYRPLDFQEHIVNNMTYELLEQTCHLKSIPPLNSFRNDCPNVSITKFCPYDDMDVSITSNERYSNTKNTYVESSYFNSGNQFYLQSNVTIPNNESVRQYIQDDSTSNAYSLKITWIIMTIRSFFMIMII